MSEEETLQLKRLMVKSYLEGVGKRKCYIKEAAL